MKSTLTYNSLDALAPWPALLTQQLEHWHSLTTVTSAEVILEQQRNDGRPFRVKVRLEGPAPSLRAEGRDATLEGALLLATRDLEHQIEVRKTQPVGGEKARRSPARFPDGGPVAGPGERRTRLATSSPRHLITSDDKAVQLGVIKKERNKS